MMFRSSTSAVFCLAWVCILLPNLATPSEPHNWADLRQQGFRSAYLMRGRHPVNVPRIEFHAERLSLQAHFGLIIDRLIAQTDKSLDTALSRLESAQGASWSTSERQAWRDRLRAERQRQVDRLANYRERGQFPLNQDHASHAVPIFVDRHDTACAVGHLMQLAGWEDQVAAISRSNNLVYVPDVKDGPLVDWVLTSGLTQEEAALIQPEYRLLTPESHTLLGDLLQDGAALEREGLRFSNFQYEAQNYVLETQIPPDVSPEECELDPSLCPRVPIPTDEGMLPDPAHIGVGLYEGEYVTTGPFGGQPYGPDGTHWIVFGAMDARSETNGWIASRTTFGEAQRLTIEFDVTTALPHTTMTGGHIADEPNICLGCGRGPSYTLQADFETDDQSLGSVRLDKDHPGSTEQGFLLAEDSVSFEPQQTLHVEATLWNRDFTFTNALLVEFTVEPDETWTPGDFDFNSRVNGDDFLIWQANYGQRSQRGATFLHGDGDLDRDMDGDDFLLWQRAFAEPPALQQAPLQQTPVPEPTGALLLLLSCPWVRLLCRRAESRQRPPD